jgi:hypothetical protein
MRAPHQPSLNAEATRREAIRGEAGGKRGERGGAGAGGVHASPLTCSAADSGAAMRAVGDGRGAAAAVPPPLALALECMCLKTRLALGTLSAEAEATVRAAKLARITARRIVLMDCQFRVCVGPRGQGS